MLIYIYIYIYIYSICHTLNPYGRLVGTYNSIHNTTVKLYFTPHELPIGLYSIYL